jgi:hypothetical protein
MSGMLARALLFTSGSLELSLVVKATVLLGLTLIGVRLARDARASVRHAGLAATFGVLLALPIAAVLMPGVVVGIPIAQVRDSTAPLARLSEPGAPDIAGIVRASTAVRDQWPAALILFRAAWAVGAVLFLVPLAAALVRLRSVGRRGLPWPTGEDLVRRVAAQAGIRRRVDVLLHEDAVVPVTYGVARPVILLPADAQTWSEGDLRQAIVHELDGPHRRRGRPGAMYATGITAAAIVLLAAMAPLRAVGRVPEGHARATPPAIEVAPRDQPPAARAVVQLAPSAPTPVGSAPQAGPDAPRHDDASRDPSPPKPPESQSMRFLAQVKNRQGAGPYGAFHETAPGPMTGTSVQAQSTIAGMVTDISGAALEGVIVWVESDALAEKSRKVTTDTSGTYQVADLPAGSYTLTFTLIEYQSYKREGLEVTADSTATVNATLKENRIRD